MLPRLPFITATLAFTLAIYGLILRRSFHHGNECDMTWSVIRFINLSLPEQKTRRLPYRLLKFTDGRDWRYEHLIDYSKQDPHDKNTFEVVASENWCLTGNAENRQPGYIVIFVPGHEGQYTQARSLGAHGINLTRRNISQERARIEVNKLWTGEKSSGSSYVDNFVFDVYTVDFNEEAGGLHSSRLFAQVEFLIESLERINEECGDEYANDITIVGHSLGGLVGRNAAVKINQMRLEKGAKPLVRNVITLSTPHLSIPFAFDSSIYKFHQAVIKEGRLLPRKVADDLTLLSISGGLRDELIPPSLCYAGDDSITIFASEAMPSRTEKSFEGVRFGMDHNAIVWCHGLLKLVRNLIYTMSTHNPSSYEALSKDLKNEDCNYQCLTLEKDVLLRNEFGWLGAFAIKISMIYNGRLVIILYATNGIFVNILRTFGMVNSFWYFLIPVLSSVAIISVIDEPTVEPGSMVALAFNAMNLYYFILHAVIPSVIWLLRKHVQVTMALAVPIIRPPAKKAFVRQQFQFTLTAFILIYVLVIASSAKLKLRPARNLLFTGAFFFLVLILVIFTNISYLAFWPRDHPRQNEYQSLCAILLIVFPLSGIGKLIFATSLLSVEGQFRAKPYFDFEGLEWQNYCDGKNKFVCMCVSFFKYDFVQYAAFVCAPTYIATAWMVFRRRIFWELEDKKGS